MVGDTILKPGANAFLTPILFAYRPKIFIFALRRSVSELVLGGQSTTKFFFQLFSNVNFSFLGEIFIYFFFQNFWFLILFPKFQCLFVILVHFWSKSHFWAFSFHLWFYSFTFRLRFQVVQKDSKFLKSGQIKYHENLKKPH